MSTYRQFIFEDYWFNADSSVLQPHYSYRDQGSHEMPADIRTLFTQSTRGV